MIDKKLVDDVSHVAADIKMYHEAAAAPMALVAGEAAMKDAGEAFLPKNDLDSPKSYKAKLARATLLNAYAKTGTFLAGQVLERGVKFDDDMPDTITACADDITKTGEPLNVFARQSFFDGICEGASIVMVDAPAVDGEKSLTVAQESRLGIRPFFKRISVKSLLGVRVEAGQITMLRYAEKKEVPAGKYGVAIKNCVRVVEPGRWRLFEKNEKNEYVLSDEGTYKVDYVPVCAFIPGKKINAVCGLPPMLDLATLNLHHWRSQADQNNILHYVRSPFLAARGYDLEQFISSSQNAINSDENWASIKYCEISGAGGVEAGRKDLQDCEHRMGLYGLQQLMPRAGGNVTATERAISSAESNSNLGAWATEFEDFMHSLFVMWADFAGVGDQMPRRAVTVNKEYNLNVYSDTEANFLLGLVDRSVLSASNAFAEAKRRGMIGQGFDWADNLAEIENERRGGGSLDFGA